MWARGLLPNLHAIAERGSTAPLRSAYHASPTIWTTIATGRRPDEHGITDFIVATPSGDAPVSSSVRRVPALWNMLSRVGKRVAVVGWWASWPAEEVNGVVISDRATFSDLDRRVFPPAQQQAFDADVAAAERDPRGFDLHDLVERHDAATARAAERLAGEGFDAELVYFRNPDAASHVLWRYVEPAKFPPLPAAQEAAGRAHLEHIYSTIDAAIGSILAAAPRDANVVVLSDHGFRPQAPEKTRVMVDLDAVLVALGYEARGAAGIDWPHTRLYAYDSPDYIRRNLVRFALAGREPHGVVRPAERPALRAAIERDLARVRWPGGGPAFEVRDALPREQKEGGDFVVRVVVAGADAAMLLDGKPIAGAVGGLSRLSGTHGPQESGLFLAAGPDIARGATLDGIGVHDMAPTLLYALGQPAAEDMAGKAWTALFTAEFRAAHPPRTIRSWGPPREGRVESSQHDAEMLRQLRALGYL